MNPLMGVYFRRTDYASFWRRVLADLIDLLVLTVLCLALLFVVANMVDVLTAPVLKAFLLACLALAILYLVVLKRSRFRTLGYRVGRLKVIGMDGLTPGYTSLLLRFVFSTLGPLNWLIDLTWLSHDPHRQALRDKFANTYVVKVGAQPAGQGQIIFRQYDIWSYHCLFREIEAHTPD